MYSPEIVELIKASRAMIDGKGWHEIDGDCSICLRFKKALEVAETTAIKTEKCKTEKHLVLSGSNRCMVCGKKVNK